jgi:2-polyprenyl-3-methyl-5-hydroxy-6-metoxy-1,4-benzoquinol methylase
MGKKTQMKKINDQMKKELVKNTHFGKAKNQPYQTIGDLHGSRDMKYRFKFMNIPENFEGKTVLDIGCNMGMVCMEAKDRGASRVVGVDYDKKIITTAKKFFKENNCDGELYQFNVNDGLQALQKLIGDDQFDYVFALAIWGTVKKPILWSMINYYCTDTCWMEGHNKEKGKEEKIKKELTENLIFSDLSFLGNTKDRGIRPTFRMVK